SVPAHRRCPPPARRQPRPAQRQKQDGGVFLASSMMCTLMEYLTGKASIIGEPLRRERNAVRPFRPDHAFAAERVPDHLIFQSGGVTGENRCLAQMEMVPMGVRELGDRDMTVFLNPAGLGKPRNGLQQGKRAQLKRIELGG